MLDVHRAYPLPRPPALTTPLPPPPCRFAEQQQRRAAAAAAPPAEAPQPAASGREELATLRKEQAAYDRAAMQAEQERNTQQLVDSMWQSLE